MAPRMSCCELLPVLSRRFTRDCQEEFEADVVVLNRSAQCPNGSVVPVQHKFCGSSTDGNCVGKDISYSPKV